MIDKEIARKRRRQRARVAALYYGRRSFSVTPSGPTNTVAPAVTGTPTVGETLSCSTGTWSGTGTISYAYQWQRDGSNISGATSSTYTLVEADASTSVRCVVTATDDIGSTSANSNAVSVAALAGALSELGTNGAIPAGATFTRTGTAWAIGSDGGVDSYAEDAPRYHYDLGEAATGLLIEGARTNEVANHTGANANWTLSSVTAVDAVGTGPSGATDTTTITPSNVNARVEPLNGLLSISAGDTLSAQIWVKSRASSNDLDMLGRFTGGTVDQDTNEYNPATGAIVSTGTDSASTETRNGWYIFGLTDTDDPADNTSFAWRVFPDRTGGTVLAEVWGAQVEQAPFCSSPILSSGAVTTRNAETCTDAISGTPSEVVLTANGVAAPGLDGDQVWLQVDDGDDNDRITIRRNSSGNIICERLVGGVSQSSIDLGALANGAQALVEVESTASTFRARIDGGTISTDNTGSHPSGLTTARFGHNAAGGNHMFGVLLGSDQATGTKIESGTLS